MNGQWKWVPGTGDLRLRAPEISGRSGSADAAVEIALRAGEANRCGVPDPHAVHGRLGKSASARFSRRWNKLKIVLEDAKKGSGLVICMNIDG